MSGGIAYVLDEDGGFAGPLQHGARRPRAARRRGRRDASASLVEEHASAPARRSRRACSPSWDDVAAAVRQGDAARLQARARRARRRERARRYPDDHPVSSGGEGFVTAEVESGTAGLMGELGALPQARPGREPGARARRARARLPRVRPDARRRRAREPGRALHGVRRPVLPQRLPGQQPDPGLERPRLPRPVARARSSSSTARTTSPTSPAGSARRRARRRACSRSARARR